jgi:hypothetical protein
MPVEEVRCPTAWLVLVLRPEEVTRAKACVCVCTPYSVRHLPASSPHSHSHSLQLQLELLDSFLQSMLAAVISPKSPARPV